MKTKLNSKLTSIFAALVAAVSFVLPSAAEDVADLTVKGQSTVKLESWETFFSNVGKKTYINAEAIEIKLTRDSELPVNKEICLQPTYLKCALTLDLNGYTLTYNGNNAAVMVNYAGNGYSEGKNKLIIKDSSANETGLLVRNGTSVSAQTAVIMLYGDAELTVESGTIKDISSGSASMVISDFNHFSGTPLKININGGHIISDSKCSDGRAVNLAWSDASGYAICNVTGGEIRSTKYGMMINSGVRDAVTISGGEIYGGWYGLYVGYTVSAPAYATITGGKITSGSSGIYAVAGSVAVSGGEIVDNPTAGVILGANASGSFTSGTIAGNTCGLYLYDTSATLSVEGGRYSGSMAVYDKNSGSHAKFISGGIYSTKPAEGAIVDGYAVVENTDPDTKEVYQWMIGVAAVPVTICVSSGGDDAEGDGSAEKPFATLAKAVATAKSGDTVKLLTDETGNLALSEAKDLSLDLGGKTLTGSITVAAGSLVLSGAGTITGTVTGATVADGFLMSKYQQATGVTEYSLSDPIYRVMAAEDVAVRLTDTTDNVYYFKTLGEASCSYVRGGSPYTGAITITMLKDNHGGGLCFEQKDTTVTVDFGGFTYTVDSDQLAGSDGTTTQAAQILKRITMTFKNGTLIANHPQIKDMIRCYAANMTFDKMVIDGTKMTNPRLTVVCLNGEMHLKNGTKVLAAANTPALSAEYYSSYKSGLLYIDDNTVEISGPLTYDRDSGTIATMLETVKHIKPADYPSELSIPDECEWVDYTEGKKFLDYKKVAQITVGEVTTKFYTLDDAVAAAGDNDVDIVVLGDSAKLTAPEGWEFKTDSTTGVTTLVKKEAAVCQIGETTYPSLAAAVAAVPTDGTKTTIKMITDEAFSGDAGKIAIASTKNVVLDLNGCTLSYTTEGYGAFIANNGTLEITDTSDAKLGKITAKFANPNWMDGCYTVDNGNDTSGKAFAKLTITAGTIENTSNSGLAWPVNNGSWNSNAETTINGGTIHSVNYVPVRQYLFYAGSKKLVINGGTFVSDSSRAVAVQFNDAVVKESEASVVINGGDFSCNGSGILYMDLHVANVDTTGLHYEVNGGRFSNVSTSAPVVVYDDEGNSQTSAKLVTKFISGGVFSQKPADDVIAEGYQAIENADGTWTVGMMIDPGTGEQTVPAFEQQSGSSVDEQKVDQVVTDETAKTAIKQETVVEGVKLTTTPKKSGDTVIAPAGMQAVVDAAKAKNAELAVALEAETASMVTVKVEVAVSPVKYENATEASQSVAAFKLDPKATVTVVNTTGTGTEAVTTSKSETVKVTNDMIDQTAGIAVTIFTGFQPEMIVHKDENGKVIETFTADQIVWNADKKTATVTITHFSTLEAVKVSYAAQAGDGLYGTLAEAFAAVPDATPTTVKVLKDLTLTDGVTFAASKTATLDFAGRTITGGSITSAGALTLTGGTTDAALACMGSGTMAITGGDYTTALPTATDPAATNAGPFFVSGGTFVSAIPWAYCTPGYEPQEKGDGKYGVKDANIFIRNIAAAQRYPWNGYVDITLDVCWSDKATARLFVLAYDGDDNRMDMTGASVIVDGVATDVDCSKGFEVTASEKKTIHLMWNSAEAVSKGQVKEGVHFKFIAK